MRARIALAIALGLQSACSAGAASRSRPAPLRLSGDATTLTWYDLQYQNETESAYTAVAHLRPSFLTARPALGGTREPTRIAVYLDGAYSGDAEVLQSIRVRDVESMQYLRGSEAAARYGTFSGTEGVLLVTLRRR